MNNSKLAVQSIVHSLGVLLYTSGVAWVLFNGEWLFGKVGSFLGPLAILLLFVFSATVVGLLVLGKPAYLYFNGARAEGVRLLLYTVGWLCLITAAVFSVLLWRR